MSAKRFVDLVRSEPELMHVAETAYDLEMIDRFTDYVMADGFSLASMVTRMERLKFETIVQGKTYAEVLEDQERRR